MSHIGLQSTGAIFTSQPITELLTVAPSDGAPSALCARAYWPKFVGPHASAE